MSISKGSVKTLVGEAQAEGEGGLMPAAGREPGCALPGDGPAGGGAARAGWREEFLEGGLAVLKRRTQDPKAAALERELKRAKRLVGDLMMDKKLLEMRIARFEGERPFPKRRSNS